ncbi:hypothetical protein HYV11_01780 [Candidatus Dependentiae bacterium]|nr:hypothetical protein [Candidatus Dependentiae bacterium]
MKKLILFGTNVLLWINFSINLLCRSSLRIPDQTIPSIIIRPSNPDSAATWYSKKLKTKIKKEHSLRNPYLRISSLKQGFDQAFFLQHYLPSRQMITFRNKKGAVDSEILEKQAQILINEIKEGKTEFANFIILKDRDFNYKQLCGLLVVKYKDYPFVLKLSIEHPHTMILPYTKSIESKFVFICGGMIRHLSNFTRITNLENIKKICSFNLYYLNNLNFPRKWYWKPQNSYDLEITWNKSPYHDQELFIIPSIYAVLSDYIDIDNTIQQNRLNKVAMKIATDTKFLIDPHAGNVVIEKGSKQYTLLDTENFRLMTGLDHTMNAQKYISWFLELSNNCVKIYACRTKEKRIQQCFSHNP